MKKSYQVNPEIIFRDADEHIYILDVDCNKLRTLNDVASTIWRALSEPKTMDELVDVISEEYRVSKIVARGDCEKFVTQYLEKEFFKVVPESEQSCA